MLAQNFKTEEELQISALEHRTLVTVMGMFERGEIKRKQFHMTSVDCGTRACIMGWCHRVGGKELFPATLTDIYGNEPLYSGLFMFGDARRYKENDPEHAATALRSYLTTGDARWDLAVQT